MSKGIKIAKMADWVDQGNTPKVVFNMFELKTMQRAILNCLQMTDVVASLPTGFGKSMLFQYPASLQKVNEKCILVIVPLKALLWDCIRQATDLGIIAKEIDLDLIKDYYRNDQLPQMLVATPQKIFATESTMSFLESLQAKKRVRLLVIDECHCMCEWGHDFRPAYLRLEQLRNLFSGVRLLAISATITPQAREQLSQRLFLHSAHYFQASYHRPNLYYGLLKSSSKSSISSTVVQFLKQKNLMSEPGIIYCQTIAASQSLFSDIKSELSVGLFHSKLSQNLRKQTYDNFIRESIKTIVGTICFGMGINKKNIRYVINIGVSKSPQNYYQESGRAGRDGLDSYCMTVTYPGQLNSLTFLINQGSMSNKKKAHQLLKLQQINEYSQEQYECLRRLLFRKLGENFQSKNCEKKCDNCNSNLLNDRIISKVDYYSQVQKIITQLQNTRCKFTKKQLAAHLKGKAQSNKKKWMNLGESIKGLFSKLDITSIQKIVETMVSKSLLTQVPVRSKFLIMYYKIASKQAIKKFNSFQIISYENKKLEKANSGKIDKFERYLSKKGLAETPIPKSLPSLHEMGKKINPQDVIEADVVKQKEDYDAFFNDLYGDELKEIQDSGDNVVDDPEGEGELIADLDESEEPAYLETQQKNNRNEKIDPNLEQFIKEQKSIQKQKQLKRNYVSGSKDFL